MRALADFVAGMAYLPRAVTLVARRPRLWRYVAIPLLVNLAAGALLYLTLFLAGLRAVHAFVAGLPAWAAGLASLLELLLALVVLIVTGLLLVRLALVLAAPWYDQLADRVAALEAREPEQAALSGARGMLHALSTAIVDEMQKLLFVVVASAALLLLNLLPGAGTLVAAVGGLVLGATLACLDFYHAPSRGRQLRLRGKLLLVRRHLAASLGFGLVCLGLNSIPFLNLVTIPLCVVAGTLLAGERVRRDMAARAMAGARERRG